MNVGENNIETRLIFSLISFVKSCPLVKTFRRWIDVNVEINGEAGNLQSFSGGKIEMRARDSIEKLFENFPDETASFEKEEIREKAARRKRLNERGAERKETNSGGGD